MRRTPPRTPARRLALKIVEIALLLAFLWLMLTFGLPAVGNYVVQNIRPSPAGTR